MESLADAKAEPAPFEELPPRTPVAEMLPSGAILFTGHGREPRVFRGPGRASEVFRARPVPNPTPVG